MNKMRSSTMLLVGFFIALSANTALADFEADVLALSPIAYWRLNETSGTLADNIGSLGNAADGTYTDAVTLGAAGPPSDP